MNANNCLFLFSIFLVFQQINGSLRLDPLVNTKVGLIRGVRASDGDYSKFMGIPYAKVDENNPFGLSIPYPEFEDVFEANDDTAECPQTDNTGTLDCLKLHISVPNSASSKNRLPVMVWIHGGGFKSGAARREGSGPKFLIKHEIILVHLNYRLGPYGFMCLNEPGVPGNQGLKDQLIALRWVKDNIEYFGGDVDQITLGGQSAGGASVDLHLLYDEEYFFSKVIMHSGTGLGPLAITEPDLSAPVKIAAELGFTGNNIEALNFLATTDTNLVIAAAEKTGLAFKPCVEKDLNDDTFITIDSKNVKAPNPKIPILVGSTEDEVVYLYADSDLTSIGNVFYDRLVTSFDFGNDLTKIVNIIRHFYIGDEEITNSVKTGVVDFDSDFLFQHPIERSIEKYLENGAEVYRYLFSYMGQRNFGMRRINATFDKASHSDDLGYLFDQPIFLEEPVTEEDALMIDRMTTLWTNFVKFGNPTPETSELLPVKWIPATKDKMHYLHLDSELTVKQRPFKERNSFWDLFYEAYGDKQRVFDRL